MKIRVVKKGVGTELKDCGDADFEIWTVMDQEDLDKFFSNKSVMSLIGMDESEIISFKALEEGGKYGLGAGKAQADLAIQLAALKLQLPAEYRFSDLPIDAVVTNKMPEFQNREREIKTITRRILENFQKVQSSEGKGTGSESQYGLTLITSAQMFGSGKSTLGSHYLEQLSSARFQSLLSEFSSEFGQESIKQLLSLKYVALNLRQGYALVPVEVNVRKMLVKSLLSVCPLEMQTQVIGYFKNKLVLDVTSLEIVEYFTKLLGGQRFFVHVDELDALEEKLNVEVLPQKLYALWNELHMVQYSFNVLFCTGRSPILFLLGKGHFSAQGLKSPYSAKAECVVLDSLKQRHIRELLTFKTLPSVATADLDLASSIIYRRCAGVPRFVTHAVEYLEKGATIDALSSNSFCTYVKAQAEVELERYKNLTAKQKVFFVELLRVAALQVPFNCEAKIEGEMWGFPPGSMNLEICAAFPVYLEKISQDEGKQKPQKGKKATKPSGYVKPPTMFRLVVPEIMPFVEVVENDPRLPFWNPGYYPFSSTGATVLEDLTRNCLKLRISEELAQGGGMPLQAFMSFFKGSHIGTKLAKSCQLKTFPKISNNPHSKTKAAISKFWDDPQPFAELNPQDKGKLLECMPLHTIFMPREKSASSDIVHRPEAGVAEYQCKAVTKPFSTEDLVVEAQKTFYEYATAQCPVAFVVVAMNVSQELMAMCPDATTHLHFKAGRKFAGSNATFQIPPFMDIIVLLEEGLKEFLTAYNVEELKLLMKTPHSVALDRVARIIASPSKN